MEILKLKLLEINSREINKSDKEIDIKRLNDIESENEKLKISLRILENRYKNDLETLKIKSLEFYNIELVKKNEILKSENDHLNKSRLENSFLNRSKEQILYCSKCNEGDQVNVLSDELKIIKNRFKNLTDDNEILLNKLDKLEHEKSLHLKASTKSQEGS